MAQNPYMQPRRMASKYFGTCRTCGASIHPGSPIVWCGHRDVHHEACFDRNKPEPAPVPTPEPEVVTVKERMGDFESHLGPIVVWRFSTGMTLYKLDGYTVVLPEELKRKELWAAAEVAFPKVKGTYWRKATNLMIARSLAAGEPVDEVKAWMANDVLLPSSGTVVESAPRVAEVDETKVREIARTVARQEDQELAGKLGATMDEVATEAARKVLRSVVTVEVKLNGETKGKLQGLHHNVLPRVLRYVACREHVYLYGPAGTGKSTIAAQVAEALGLQFSFEAFSPDKGTESLIGFVDGHGNYRGTEFQRLYVEGGVFLADEIDNCDPQILAVLNAATANGHMVFPGIGLVNRHPDFVLIAAGNTWGQGPDSTFIGRTALDAATLDRFSSIHVPIDEDLEETVALAQIEDKALGTEWLTTVRRLRARAEENRLQVVISPRAAIRGCALLQAGCTLSEVMESRIYRGLDADTRRSLGK